MIPKITLRLWAHFSSCLSLNVTSLDSQSTIPSNIVTIVIFFLEIGLEEFATCMTLHYKSTTTTDIQTQRGIRLSTFIIIEGDECIIDIGSESMNPELVVDSSGRVDVSPQSVHVRIVLHLKHSLISVKEKPFEIQVGHG